MNVLKTARLHGGEACSSIGRLLHYHAQGPGFKIQHDINWEWWYMAEIPVLEKIRTTSQPWKYEALSLKENNYYMKS